MLKLARRSRFGLTRAALYYNDAPHLYAEGLEDDDGLGWLGVRQIARIAAIASGLIFLKRADGGEAVLEAANEVRHRLTEGLSVEVEIQAEARTGKSARAAFIAIREGQEPVRLSAPETLTQRVLRRAAHIWPNQPISEIEDLDQASEMIARARDEALAEVLDLPGGGRLSLEPTRALIACDVDGAGFAGVNVSAKSANRQCNETAMAEVARRLRLSGQAGLVVIDLIGQRHDYDRLRGLMTAALAGEAAQTIIGPITRFGTFEMTRPWGVSSLIDRMREAPALTSALDLIDRATERAQSDPGAVIYLTASHEVVALLRPHLAASYDPLSARLRLETGPEGVRTV